MRKTATAVLLAVLMLAATGLVGCGLLGNGNEAANDLITTANVHLNKHQMSDDKVRKLADEFNGLGITPADAAKALTITAAIRAELELQKTELAAASADIAKIKTLDVDETFKKYADLEVIALAAQGAYVDKGVEYYAEMDKLYTAIRDGKASVTFTEEISVKVERLAGEIKTLSDASTKAIDTANTYFNKTAP
jgi:hypothetical protein